MPVTPMQIMEVADAITSESSTEATLRTAASRSYYSLYHHALEFADNDSDVPISNLAGPTHRKLSEYFSSSVAHPDWRRKAMRRAGILLRKCHDSRCYADYSISEPFDEDVLKVMRHDCQKAIGVIEGME
ncbi:hypothetical protein RSO41_13270 [Halomonas sp. I1]|uniref:hypothetical protein n=1 Tax=Halomonas sp. I1 TaxID=393536 RepID=UPI0028DE42C8|nr:hypothetical protein [Halomonas sp. I1]MDT8895622.1 hypothetical protein [Halomonas sp. I1]